jgi:serine/threonine protein kinase
MSPEVIDGNPQGVSVDTWAMGNILFRCLYGTVAFKGVNPEKVYDDIRNRRIQWPPEEIIDKYMSKEAVDLINRMIQLSPGNRLGASLETIAILKQHPFFAGINFEEVSSPTYSGLK